MGRSGIAAREELRMRTDGFRHRRGQCTEVLGATTVKKPMRSTLPMQDGVSVLVCAVCRCPLLCSTVVEPHKAFRDRSCDGACRGRGGGHDG